MCKVAAVFYMNLTVVSCLQEDGNNGLHHFTSVYDCCFTFRQATCLVFDPRALLKCTAIFFSSSKPVLGNTLIQPVMTFFKITGNYPIHIPH